MNQETEKRNCIKCGVEILSSTYDSNKACCYRCRVKIKNDPEERMARNIINSIFGALVGIVTYFNTNLILGILGFFTGFLLGKLYNYIVIKYKLED